jgi:mannose-6-phosphate isomerase
MLYPLKLTAPLKDYIWGGDVLKIKYNKKSDLEKIAESWELAYHKDGQSLIANGPAFGMTLGEYIEQYGKKILGNHAEKFTYFPILIKLIDAKDNLSVQVHPENEYALRVEGEYGKTEMWYIVDCEAGAELLYGFKCTITKEEFKQHIENNTLLEVCNKVPVKKGDVFFIEAGTLHAIGKGILIAEIQQNSNTTYRIYDYGRLGNDGKPRDLHVQKAIDVTNLKHLEPTSTPVAEMEFFSDYTIKLLAKCEYFTVYHFDLIRQCNLMAAADTFHSILVLEGNLTLLYGTEEMLLHKGDSLFILSGMGAYSLNGKGEFILSMI